MKPTLVITDGGRNQAGFSGTTGDCVCRAIAIAAQRPYAEVYELINQAAKTERTGSRKRGRSSARSGVYKSTTHKVIAQLGGKWTATMSIGSGCQIHLTPSELPSTGRHILSVSKHLAAWVDGKLHDNHDCSRDGTRCVYGYWSF